MNNNQWNVKYLTSNPDYGITAETIETYYKFAKFNYETGNYQTGRDMIENYISLYSSPPKQRKEGEDGDEDDEFGVGSCLLYTSPSPRDRQKSRMPSSA